MTFKQNLIDETYTSKVGAIYGSQTAARDNADRLVSEGGFASEQVKVVSPHDNKVGQKLEPEGNGIRRTLLKSHFVLGGGFLIAGLLVAALLSLYGPPLTTTSPVMTFIAAGVLSLFAGLLLAGLVTLRPDHDILIHKTEAASDDEKWSVIIHCRDHEEKEKAKSLLDSFSETL